jgi:ferredoxin
MTRRRLAVDWPACKAHGVCAELLPEIVQLDEWGYPSRRPGAGAGGAEAARAAGGHVVPDARAEGSCPPRTSGRSATDLVAELVDPLDEQPNGVETARHVLWVAAAGGRSAISAASSRGRRAWRHGGCTPGRRQHAALS